MAHDVFISYSSKNKTTADAICHVLEEHEIKCWIAPRDIVGGEKYGDVIEEAIKGCKVFVIIFSEESRISPWVESELNLAFTDRRTIVPFKIDSSVLEGEMRLILNNKHWIEAYPNPELKFKDLIEAVSRSIGKPTLSEAEKHNQEVEKQLEIEKEKLRKEQFQNDKAQKDIEEQSDCFKTDLNEDSKNLFGINKKNRLERQSKKKNYLLIILILALSIGIILFFISISNKGNQDYLNSAKKDTKQIVTKESVILVSNNKEQIKKEIKDVNKSIKKNCNATKHNGEVPLSKQKEGSVGGGLLTFTFRKFFLERELKKKKIENINLLLKEGHNSDAINIYKELIYRFPKDENLYIGLAKIYNKIKEYDKAEAAFDSAHQITIYNKNRVNRIEAIKAEALKTYKEDSASNSLNQSFFR